jgi:hypothetical protein
MGQVHVRLGDQIVDDADVQLAAQLVVQLVYFGAEFLDGRQHGLAGVQHGAAFVGERKTGPATLAQADAQPLFQIAHVQADGGAADAQHAFSGGKAAAFDDGFEQAQQADIKIADLGEGFFCSSVEYF